MENKIEDYELYDGRDVANHIISITPNEEMVPWTWLDEFVRPNKFVLKDINIKELLTQLKDFEPIYYDRYTYSEYDGYYINTAEDYAEPDVTHDSLYNPIVVVGDMLVDGYSRLSELNRAGEETITAFVAVKDNDNNVQ